ncbi:FUSC family protein [Sphingomonas fuzhouensis]|uniref:FUSC family protein n=1 Tax=Sphingomonas fuzhouensis TaxID=3106033 RepID=UPI002AFE6000|nr:FUSC family protein [Sphingomonas sp. SGZ-02]
MTKLADAEGRLVDRYGLTRAIRRLGRRLELRAVSLVPEHLNRAEGYRAALAVALPLILALVTGRVAWGWAVYAAFWTCLCDTPGPDRLRRRLLAIFMASGTVIVLVGSWAAWLVPQGSLIVGPLLVFIATLGAARLAFGGLVGTLSAVVAVVAVGFPHPLTMAFPLAMAFLAGAAWSYLLITVFWRIDAFDPLHRAGRAVSARLADMAEYLAGLGDGPHRDARWHSDHAEHRRAVRLAIERFRDALVRYEGEASGPVTAARRDLAAAETMFGALLALDQACVDRWGPVGEHVALANACRRVVASGRLFGGDAMAEVRGPIQGLRASLTQDVFKGCAAALEAALDILIDPNAGHVADPAPGDGAAPPADRSFAMVQQGLRQAGGVVAVYLAAAAFGLGYPYWAAMAVIVVLQGDVRVTWSRCLERIAGSLLGGALALALPLLGGGAIVPALVAVALAAITMALRSVNYTIFVMFLTTLFVLVTDMLHPALGIASARIVDNVIGSIAAMLAVFAFRPDFGLPLPKRIAAGIAANRRYGEAVTHGEPIAVIEAARRAAGRASVDAEIALHDLGGWLHRLTHRQADVAALQDMRNLAGRAAMAWHARMANPRPGEGVTGPVA